MHLQLTRLPYATQDDRPTEVVERKGRGHPDTLCDATAEAFSTALARHYAERFGTALHHNVDKVLLVGGSATPAFGGGHVNQPIELILAGRATLEYESVRVPVDELAMEAARTVLGGTLHALDPDRHLQVRTRVRQGSGDLVELFGRDGRAPAANDSSCGVGFAPLSRLEQAVLAVERALTAAPATREHPYIGEDVKVLGVRRGSAIELTVAAATVGRHLADIGAYRDAVRTVREIAERAASEAAGAHVSVEVNAADDIERGSVYLTVTGTSAESGDDGQAGRGNRVGGLITPGRPMVMEAAAGKNPWTHPGKLYSVLADRISRALVERVDAISSANCTLVSRIGAPIDEPMLVDVQIGAMGDGAVHSLHAAVGEVVRDQLARVDEARAAIMAGTVALF